MRVMRVRDDDGEAPPSVTIELWTINRVLRWFGVRVLLIIDPRTTPDRTPTRIGLAWYGWAWLRA